MKPTTHSPDELSQIARTGTILQNELSRSLVKVRPGVTLGEIRATTEASLSQQGCEWKSLADSCVSLAVNESVINFGDDDRVLEAGDLLTFDISAEWEGWWADCARTVPVGSINRDAARLVRFCRRFTNSMIRELPGKHLWSELRKSVASSLEGTRYFPVSELAGHGIGRELHEDPQYHAFPRQDETDVELVSGMALTLEPVFAMREGPLMKPSPLALAMPEGNLACYFEETVILDDCGPRVVTRFEVPDGKRNRVLIGMPGAGKSTVGRLLAEQLGVRFLDLDELVQKSEGKSLQELIGSLGRDGFLDLEARYASKLEADGSVISTGGSVIYRPEAMDALQCRGEIVFLDTELDVLKDRLSDLTARGVAFAPDKSLEELWLERQPLYEAYYDRRVETSGRSPEEVVETLLSCEE